MADLFALRRMLVADIPAVIALAHRVWHAHYPGIITPEQIDYMLEQRYTEQRLNVELREPDIVWTVADQDGALVGFSSVHRVKDEAGGALKIDKLYIEHSLQRAGIGGRLIADAKRQAHEAGVGQLMLAVNKHNSQAIAAYQKHGFSVREAKTTEIGQGFVMDDFIMTCAA